MKQRRGVSTRTLEGGVVDTGEIVLKTKRVESDICRERYAAYHIQGEAVRTES